MVVAGIAAISLSEISLMIWLGGNDVRKFCDEIEPGLPTARLAALSKKHDVRLDLSMPPDNSGVYLTQADTPRSFGRHVCRVRHDGKQVIEGRFGYAD